MNLCIFTTYHTTSTNTLCLKFFTAYFPGRVQIYLHYFAGKAENMFEISVFHSKNSLSPAPPSLCTN